jgi:hypothetical protein
MSRNVNYAQTTECVQQQTTEFVQQSAEFTTVAYPRLLAYGYFGAVFVAMVGWLSFIGWIIWKLIDWVFA